MKNRYRTKSPRLKNYDYSSNGFYFITICTENKERLLGEIINRKMVLSDIGNAAEKYWRQIPDHFPFVVLDEFVIMPDHIHGIIKIKKNLPDIMQKQCNKFGPQSKNIGSIIRGFKIGVTKYTKCRNAKSCVPALKQSVPAFAWQPRYYDRVIRDEIELNRIRVYIKNNPIKWHG